MMKCVSAALVAGLALAGPAHAQFFLKLADGIGLTNEDYAAMKSQSETMYLDKTPAVGDKVDWSNPASGAHGWTEVTAFDGTCVTLRHVLTVDSRNQNFDFNQIRCKADDGRWLIQNIE